MIGPIKTVGIYVEDQDRAIDFYTRKLGFEIRRIQPMGTSAQWVEVAPPGTDTCLVLYPRSLMSNWTEMKPSVVFHCSNVETTCKELEAAGVRITMQPTPMAWGIFAMFLDLDGNPFGLTSRTTA